MCKLLMQGRRREVFDKVLTWLIMGWRGEKVSALTKNLNEMRQILMTLIEFFLNSVQIYQMFRVWAELGNSSQIRVF